MPELIGMRPIYESRPARTYSLQRISPLGEQAQRYYCSPDHYALALEHQDGLQLWRNGIQLVRRPNSKIDPLPTDPTYCDWCHHAIPAGAHI